MYLVSASTPQESLPVALLIKRTVAQSGLPAWLEAHKVTLLITSNH